MQNALTGGAGLFARCWIETLVVWVRSTHCSAFSSFQTPPQPVEDGLTTGLVHRLYFLVSFGKREVFTEVEGVLHLAGRVVLRLKEGVEIPERLLDDAPVQLLEPHLKKDLPHLGDDPLVRVDLAGIRLLRELGHVVPAEL